MFENLQLLIDYPSLGVDLIANGLMIGAIFALAAFGMALVWGVLGIINIAQGEFVMLGGFVALTAAGLGVPPLLTIPLAAIALFILGWGLYRLVIFRVVDRDLFVSLLATFGLSIILQQLSNEIFGADVRTLETGLGTMVLFDGQIVLAEIKLVSFVTALTVGLVLWAFLKRARLGQAIRATAQNARAARILGIDTDRVYAATYALNAALCGAAGSLVVMAWTIHPYIGLPYTVRSFLVVIVAGLGNIVAVITAGLGLGALENLAGFILGAEYQQAIVVGLLLVVLGVRQIQQMRSRQVVQ